MWLSDATKALVVNFCFDQFVARAEGEGYGPTSQNHNFEKVTYLCYFVRHFRQHFSSQVAEALCTYVFELSYAI